jgi:hypothetical protein
MASESRRVGSAGHRRSGMRMALPATEYPNLDEVIVERVLIGFD